jgi:hypothetical protein
MISAQAHELIGNRAAGRGARTRLARAGRRSRKTCPPSTAPPWTATPCASDDPAASLKSSAKFARATPSTAARAGPGHPHFHRRAAARAYPGPEGRHAGACEASGSAHSARKRGEAPASNVRRRGEDARAGRSVARTGNRCSMRRRWPCSRRSERHLSWSRNNRAILHLTTGDEIVPPEQTPGPGKSATATRRSFPRFAASMGSMAVTHFGTRR